MKKIIAALIIMFSSSANAATALIDLYEYQYTQDGGAVEAWHPYTSNYSVNWFDDHYELSWDRGQSIDCLTCILSVNGARSAINWDGKATMSFTKTTPFYLLIQNDTNCLTPVPEPVTLLLLGAGIVITSLKIRRAK